MLDGSARSDRTVVERLRSSTVAFFLHGLNSGFDVDQPLAVFDFLDVEGMLSSISLVIPKGTAGVLVVISNFSEAIEKSP